MIVEFFHVKVLSISGGLLNNDYEIRSGMLSAAIIHILIVALGIQGLKLTCLFFFILC